MKAFIHACFSRYACTSLFLIDKKVNQKDRITQQKTMCLSTAQNKIVYKNVEEIFCVRKKYF
jgi:hypothetical protein